MWCFLPNAAQTIVVLSRCNIVVCVAPVRGPERFSGAPVQIDNPRGFTAGLGILLTANTGGFASHLISERGFS